MMLVTLPWFVTSNSICTSGASCDTTMGLRRGASLGTAIVTISSRTPSGPAVHPDCTNRSHEGGASRISCRPSQTGDLSMSPTIAAHRPAAVDYERTLILSIEVSNQNWVLAAQVPGLPHTKAKRTV